MAMLLVVFLVLVLAAVGLGLAGALVNGLLYLLIIGVVVFVADLIFLGAVLGRHSARRPAR